MCFKTRGTYFVGAIRRVIPQHTLTLGYRTSTLKELCTQNCYHNFIMSNISSKIALRKTKKIIRRFEIPISSGTAPNLPTDVWSEKFKNCINMHVKALLPWKLPAIKGTFAAIFLIIGCDHWK